MSFAILRELRDGCGVFSFSFFFYRPSEDFFFFSLICFFMGRGLCFAADRQENNQQVLFCCCGWLRTVRIGFQRSGRGGGMFYLALAAYCISCRSSRDAKQNIYSLPSPVACGCCCFSVARPSCFICSLLRSHSLEVMCCIVVLRFVQKKRRNERSKSSPPPPVTILLMYLVFWSRYFFFLLL